MYQGISGSDRRRRYHLCKKEPMVVFGDALNNSTEETGDCHRIPLAVTANEHQPLEHLL